MADISKIKLPDSETIYNVKDTEARKRVPEVLLKDTVGWVGKNENKTPYYDGTSKTENGVTFFVDGNGVIGLANTASADAQFYMHSRFAYDMQLKAGSYKISGGINDDIYLIAARNNTTGSSSGGGSQLAVDKGSGASFTINETIDFQFIVFVKNGTNASGKTVYPMLYKASITDDTYEPYHASVEQILRDAEVIEGKNLLHIPDSVVSQTINGITFTVTRNANGEVTSIVANGTATAQMDLYIGSTLNLTPNTPYKLSGCPSGGSSSTYHILVKRFAQSNPYDSGNGLDFSVESSDTYHDVYIRVQSGTTVNNLVFKPMISLDLNTTYADYEPYYIPLKDSKFDRAEQRVLGAKNLLKYPYTHTTKTVNGITFTDNGDGTITASGTAMADAEFYCVGKDSALEAGKKYILSGCPSGGSSSTYRLSYTNNTDKAYQDYGDGIEIIGFATTYATRSITILVKNGTDLTTPIVFKPMLRLASDPDDTYVPYAMTNRELTEMATVQESALTTSQTVDTVAGNHLYKFGKVVMLIVRLNDVTTTSNYEIIATIPEGYRPKSVLRLLNAIADTFPIQITQTGNLSVVTPITSKDVYLVGTWITN